ncbi:DUF2399 domain-containing protein [Brevibacillus nitrificans]|uniref:DUF2399 domain-containing protein n=1 Tax=Brevibacillus nitrificans TaxID=651560 RepID=UPI002854F979|nr:DUF2399 domain-containing protein [Brevibacillus nitrificans]MDR7315558.1 hypothetical protein [Brevibacillus nitrificans]
MDKLDPLLISYIEKFILRSSEQLEMDTGNNQPGLPFIDVNIIKRTERTYRVAGVLTLSTNQPDASAENPDEELIKLFSSKRKITLDDREPKTMRWLERGWVIREVRFKKDGKTVDSMQYRMGYRFYKYESEKALQRKYAVEELLQSLRESAATFGDNSDIPYAIHRKRGLHALTCLISEIAGQMHSELGTSPHFPAKWSVSKRMNFLHFIVAFVRLAFSRANFDWKEIGANYYREIGGSKAFDSHKDEFLAQLEEWAQCPADSLGMTSLGKITPLYFSGKITGQFSAYRFGPVHALTDLAIAEEEYTTEATTIWLVENRAILTRMAAEQGFLQETNSLVLCVDGHLRSSHRLCIRQLVKNGTPEQIIIWSDYDPDGLIIAKELYLAVDQHRVAFKWITHDFEVMTVWEEYEEYMKAFLKQQRAEQEQVLGGAEDWKKWIAH